MGLTAKQYKTLQAKWYKKLKKSGFEDHEQDEFFLKSYSGRVSARDSNEFSEDELNAGGYLTWDYVYADTMRSEAKAEYYRWCSHMLNDWVFKTKRERKIFEMHSEGLGVRQIAKALKTYKRKIHEELRALIGRMKGK